MMTRTRKILFVVLATLLIGVFLAQQALLNAAVTSAAEYVPNLTNHRAVLVPEKNTVEVRRAGSNAWIVVTKETELAQGDSVRTGSGASASLNLFEQGVTRLDENATITLDRLSWNAETNSFTGRILLGGGRLWSRLLDFMAPESSYEVKTPHLVATVRGTTFFVEASDASESVTVVEHLVHIVTANGSAAADVGRDKKWRFAAPPAGLQMRTSTPVWTIDDAKSSRVDAWVRNNLEKDQAYVDGVEARLQGTLERFAPRPDMSARIEKKERASLSSSADIQKIATRELTRLAAELFMAAERNDAPATRTMLERAERFCDAVKAKGAACRVHPRLVEFAAHRFAMTSELREAVLNVSPDMAETMRRVFERRQKFETRSGAADTVSATGVGATTMPSTQPVGDGAASSTASTPTAPVPVRLELSAQRFSFTFGQSGAFNAYLRWSDGRSEDVTKNVVWTLGVPATGAVSIGSMRANVFVAGNIEGEATLTASYAQPLGTFTASDVVRVTALTPLR